jgi:hypothetical protein
VAAIVSPLPEVKDALLTDIAVRIQLPPSLYRLAIERVQTLAQWLDRPESELSGLVTIVYPQGSMAIHATIAACLDKDEFDIDVIVQLVRTGRMSAATVLDTLYGAIKGEKGSRYYEMTRRNTRCVTVRYGDMHVDLTPAELVPNQNPRVSDIFHHRPENLSSPGERIVANPFGFAEWFNHVATRFQKFDAAYGRQSIAMDTIMAKAGTENVPEQMPAYLKPPAVVALQLIKRFRNIRYESRRGRKPPGVLLAKFVGESSSSTGQLFDELLFQARKLKQRFSEAQSQFSLINVVNPTCPQDCFSDRWPANLDEQRVFLDDLDLFVSELEKLQRNADLERIGAAFTKLFGERISRAAIEAFADSSGQRIAAGTLLTERISGRVDLHGSGLVAAVASTASNARAAPKHTFYGPNK